MFLEFGIIVHKFPVNENVLCTFFSSSVVSQRSNVAAKNCCAYGKQVDEKDKRTERQVDEGTSGKRDKRTKGQADREIYER